MREHFDRPEVVGMVIVGAVVAVLVVTGPPVSSWVLLAIAFGISAVVYALRHQERRR